MLAGLLRAKYEEGYEGKEEDFWEHTDLLQQWWPATLDGVGVCCDTTTAMRCTEDVCLQRDRRSTFDAVSDVR